jgi:MFS family permease
MMSDRIGYRLLTTIGATLSTLAIFALSQISANANSLEVTSILTVAGIGSGLFASPNLSSIMGSINPADRGSGASAHNTIWNVASMMAMTVAFVFIGTTVNISQFTMLFIGSSSNLPASMVNSLRYQAEWAPFMGAFRAVFFTFTLVVVISIIPAALRPKGKARVLSSIDSEQGTETVGEKVA